MAQDDMDRPGGDLVPEVRGDPPVFVESELAPMFDRRRGGGGWLRRRVRPEVRQRTFRFLLAISMAFVVAVALWL